MHTGLVSNVLVIMGMFNKMELAQKQKTPTFNVLLTHTLTRNYISASVI